MILVDTALKRRAEAGNPVQFALYGAGAMGKGIANQVLNHMTGINMPVICNRTVETAIAVYTSIGVAREDIVEVSTPAALDEAIAAGRYAVTADPAVPAGAGRIEAVLDATGHVDYGAVVALHAIEGGKHIVLLNAELDGTVGPLLKTKADAAGVVLTGCDGDQPAVQINLLRFVETLGLTPRVLGNIKGMQDRYRTPTTQAAFAKEWNQTPHMVTSFADGTKIAFEQAITANATGMTVARRGMIGPEHRGLIDEVAAMYDIDELRSLGGIVDYCLGGLPSPGVYVFAEAVDDLQTHYLKYSKLGDGPLYSFYVPYHLMIFEAPISVARAVLFDDAAIKPDGAPKVDVIATAKRDLKAGETVDGLGGYMTYGLCETYAITRGDALLPVGIAEGAKLKRDVAKDQVLTYADVDLPTDSVAGRLRAEQDALFEL